MNVLVVNGSARKEKGYTAMILNPFMDGMKIEYTPFKGEVDA